MVPAKNVLKFQAVEEPPARKTGVVLSYFWTMEGPAAVVAPPESISSDNKLFLLSMVLTYIMVSHRVTLPS
jgi:hypothetical protein